MLYHLPYAGDDKFRTIIDKIKDSYWPQTIYSEHVQQNREPKLPQWPSPPPAHKRIEEIRQSLLAIVNKISRDHSQYFIFKKDPNESSFIAMEILPFVSSFHQYFLERQWTAPLRDPHRHHDELFQLSPPSEEDENRLNTAAREINFSKNWRDYSHFVNVVMATARLIQYFNQPDKIVEVMLNNLMELSPENQQRLQKEAKIMAYPPEPLNPDTDSRVFKLMLAAFYHDIGKTVVYHRHAMEGSIIMASYTINVLNQFNNITQHYRGSRLERDDLLFISDLVFFHDQFGTLGTGEAGYLRLVDVVDRVKRYSLKKERKEGREGQINLSKQSIFDLWMLNIADIMVSLKDKEKLQERWLNKDTAENIISSFFKSDRADWLQHDLRIALNLLDEQNKHWDSDNISYLEEIASNDYAHRHVVERIRRLLIASLVKFDDNFNECFSNEFVKLSEENWNSIIKRCIQSVNDFSEFSDRLAWIGQMDYALGFFRKIVDRAIQHTINELKEQSSVHLGWIHRGDASDFGEDFLKRANSESFASNYASLVVHIIEHLLFRGREINQFRNLEFEEASNHLTPDKIDQILSIEGPFKSGQAIQFILQTIFMYP